MGGTVSHRELLEECRRALRRKQEERLEAVGAYMGPANRGGRDPAFKRDLDYAEKSVERQRRKCARLEKAPKLLSHEGADRDAATDLQLFAINSKDLYASRIYTLDSLRMKWMRGKYNSDMAVKKWLYWVDKAAKRYVKENARGTPWNRMFPKPTRVLAAKELEQRYRSSVEHKDW